MRSPITALTWEIWRRNRASFWVVIGILLFACAFNSVLPESFRDTESRRTLVGAVDGVLMASSLLILFGVFNITESSRSDQWTGFPYRFFVLPLSTLGLVLLPLVLGIICVELAYGAWVRLVFIHGEIEKPWWFAGLLGTYMVVYQSLLWGVAGFRISRVLCLGFSGVIFVFIACLPWVNEIAPIWLSEKVLSLFLAALTLISFIYAFVVVGQQRCGGGRRINSLKALAERFVDALPGRSSPFNSPAQAQLWFEWRRAGVVLPACVGVLLLVFIAPLSWLFRNDANGTLWILGWTLGMPVILAAPIGKAFSKADFWSRDLSVPPFAATRPLATGEFVVVRMKVAAVSATISWVLVVVFLVTWLTSWANLDTLSMIRIGFWMAYGHSVYPQYLIAALFVVMGLFLTWKLLVGGLWVGLSGNKKLFVISAAIYCLVPLGALITLTILANHDDAVRAWVRKDPDQLLIFLEWTAALALMGKFWMAARWWNRIAPVRTRNYLLMWSGGTACLAVLALLVWAHGLIDLTLMAMFDFLPLDVFRLRNLLILLALLLIPFARLALAPLSLATNRHGGGSKVKSHE